MKEHGSRLEEAPTGPRGQLSISKNTTGGGNTPNIHTR